MSETKQRKYLLLISIAEEEVLANADLVITSTHHEELSRLVDQERIYLAGQPHASGILEAIEYYRFVNACKAPGDQ